MPSSRSSAVKAILPALVPGAFLAAAAFTGIHAVDVAQTAARHPGAQQVLLALYAALRTVVVGAFALFTVGRAAPHRRCHEPLAFAACAAAMVSTLLVTHPNRDAASGLLFAGDLVAVCGCVWLVCSVLALGRCFGVLPEARGLVTRGPYRLVRHPVYLGEIIALAGLVVAAPAAWNAVVLIMLIAAQYVRVRFEERALAEAFPEYADYARHTGRLLPWVGCNCPASACAVLPPVVGSPRV